MFSSGSDSSTAEWAARLKAHWTFANLGGRLAKHPGIQGVWGDNFLWWNRNFDNARSSGGSPLEGDATRWDDGLVRNHQKLRDLLGPNFLLGGNGAGWACSGYTRYYGTIRNGGCTAADAAMWEDAGRYIYDAAGWDRYVPYFTDWIEAGSSEGRQKYGIMAEYGTCGFGNLGHPLTPGDLRLGLAMATIGGIDLWAVHDCDWGRLWFRADSSASPRWATARRIAGDGLGNRHPTRLVSTSANGGARSLAAGSTPTRRRRPGTSTVSRFPRETRSSRRVEATERLFPRQANLGSRLV